MSLLITKHWRLQCAKSRLQIQTCLFCDNIKIKKNKSSGKKYKDTVYLPKTDFVLSLKKNKTGIELQVMHVHDYVLSWQIFLVMILTYIKYILTFELLYLNKWDISSFPCSNIGHQTDACKYSS